MPLTSAVILLGKTVGPALASSVATFLKRSGGADKRFERVTALIDSGTSAIVALPSDPLSQFRAVPKSRLSARPST